MEEWKNSTGMFALVSEVVLYNDASPTETSGLEYFTFFLA
jgi:hypothetical protein